MVDVLPKLIAHELIRPALALEGEPVRLICREASAVDLLARLAVHRLDVILSRHSHSDRDECAGLQPPAGEFSGQLPRDARSGAPPSAPISEEPRRRADAPADGGRGSSKVAGPMVRRRGDPTSRGGRAQPPWVWDQVAKLIVTNSKKVPVLPRPTSNPR